MGRVGGGQTRTGPGGRCGTQMESEAKGLAVGTSRQIWGCRPPEPPLRHGPATCSGPGRGHPALGADTDLHKEMGAWGRAGGRRGVEVAPWRGDAQDGSAQRHVTSRRRAPPVLQALRSCSVAPGGRPPGGTVLLEALRTLADVAENDRAGAGRPKGRHSFGLGQVPFIFPGQIEARYLSSWLADT